MMTILDVNNVHFPSGMFKIVVQKIVKIIVKKIEVPIILSYIPSNSFFTLFLIL